MIPLGCSGSCQDRETLFLDVRSFLIIVMGDGARIEGGKKEANGVYHWSNPWQGGGVSI